jgi:hypothetical protein
MRHVGRQKVLPLLGLGLFLSFVGPPARSEEIPNIYDNAIGSAVYGQGQTEIPGLAWSGENGQPDFTIETLKNGKPAARVKGKFESKNAGTLLFSSEIIQRAQYTDDAGNFTVLIPLSNRKTPVKVSYIDDYGNKKSQDIQIVYENYFQHQLTQQTKKRWNFDGGASISYLDYTQTAATADVKITQIGLTPKFGVTFNATSKLDFGASVFGTLAGLPMTKSPDGLSTPRFYGINMRVGYKIYGLRRGNIYLMTGPYFWGMLVPPSENGLSYGVVKLSGPQLFVVGRFLTDSGRTVVGYLKGASILDGDGGMSQNREYAIGGAYQITPPKAKRRFMVNLDFASASFIVAGENIKLNSFSLGISTAL